MRYYVVGPDGDVVFEGNNLERMEKLSQALNMADPPEHTLVMAEDDYRKIYGKEG